MSKLESLARGTIAGVQGAPAKDTGFPTYVPDEDNNAGVVYALILGLQVCISENLFLGF
jgi:hypothetical protein